MGKGGFMRELNSGFRRFFASREGLRTVFEMETVDPRGRGVRSKASEQEAERREIGENLCPIMRIKGQRQYEKRKIPVVTRADGDTLPIFSPSLLVSDGPANRVFILVRLSVHCIGRQPRALQPGSSCEHGQYQ